MTHTDLTILLYGICGVSVLGVCIFKHAKHVIDYQIKNSTPDVKKYNKVDDMI
jgi:hypothetical protein